MGRKFFVFKFKSAEDVKDVLEKVSWIIHENLVVLKTYDNSMPLEDYEYTHQVFSFMFKGLALEHVYDGILDKLCQDIGRKIVKKGSTGFTKIGRVVSVKIEVDLSQPLNRGKWLLNAGKQKVWIRYHFEKQPRKIYPDYFTIDHNE